MQLMKNEAAACCFLVHISFSSSPSSSSNNDDGNGATPVIVWILVLSLYVDTNCIFFLYGHHRLRTDLVNFVAYFYRCSESPKRFDGDKVLRLTPALSEVHLRFLDELYINALPDNYDFWKEPPALSYISSGNKPHPVDIRVSAKALPAFISQLEAIDLPFSVSVEDVQKLIDETTSEKAQPEAILLRAGGTRIPRSVVRRFADYDDIALWLTLQCRKYPELLTCHTLGQSYEKRPIHYVRVSTGPKKLTGQKKRGVLVESGVHAREWLAPATAIFLIDRLIKLPDSDPFKALLDHIEWYIIPVANPDGYQHSRTINRMWRKTRSPGVGPNEVPCFGVDANRNFDFHWSRYGSSSSTCSDLFHGNKPLSEPETKALADFIMQKRHDLLAFFSLHAYSQFWLVPYGHRKDDVPHDLDELMRVAEIGTEAIRKRSATYTSDEFESDWLVGNSLSLLQYAVSGSSMDWAKGVANVSYAYALELRPRDDPLANHNHNGFLAKESDIEPSGYEVMAGFTAAINAMLQKLDEAADYERTTTSTWVQTPSPPLPPKVNDGEISLPLTGKLAYAFGSLTTWVVSLFNKL